MSNILHSITDPKFTGNCRRIKELHKLGLSTDEIVNTFHEDGIIISPSMVRAVINGDIEIMRKKALSKSKVKKIEDERNQMNNDAIPTS